MDIPDVLLLAWFASRLCNYY